MSSCCVVAVALQHTHNISRDYYNVTKIAFGWRLVRTKQWNEINVNEESRKYSFITPRPVIIPFANKLNLWKYSIVVEILFHSANHTDVHLTCLWSLHSSKIVCIRIVNKYKGENKWARIKNFMDERVVCSINKMHLTREMERKSFLHVMSYPLLGHIRYEHYRRLNTHHWFYLISVRFVGSRRIKVFLKREAISMV